MNRNLLTILCLTLFVSVNAQLALEKKVPKEASFVLSFNINNLSQKVNFNDLGNYQFLKKSETTEYFSASSVIMELFRLPEKAGISKTGKLIMYSESHDTINNLTYLISVADNKAFEERILDIIKTKDAKPKFQKEGKLKVLNYEHKICISLAKDYAIISLWQAPYYYSYDYDEYNNERYKIIQTLDSIKYSTMELDTTAVENDFIDTFPVPPPEEQTDYYDVIDSSAAVVEEEVTYPTYGSNYDNDSLMIQFEKNWELRRKQREANFYVNHDKKMTLRQKFIHDIKPTDALANDGNYLKIMTKTDDIIYWFHYKSYSKQIIELISDKYYYGYSDTAIARAIAKISSSEKVNKLAKLIDNNTFYGLGNFNKGEIKMNFYNTFNETLKPLIEKVYSNTINPDFFKYVKSDNLIGLMGFSVNTQALSDLYYEVMRLASESSPAPNRWVVAALEWTDLFLDKNVLHHTLKGDAVIAFTGIKSYLRTYNSYEYDSLTFESRNVEKTSTNYIPEFTCILTVENLANVKRILKMIERLEGLQMESENLYSFKSRHSEINNNFFVLVKDNLVFISNDKPLVTDQINKGLATERTLDESYKTYLTNSSFGYWDASKMFKLMAEKPDETFGKDNELQKLSDKINKGVFISKFIEGSTIESEVTLELKNRENSSLLELLKLFDDIYLLNKFK